MPLNGTKPGFFINLCDRIKPAFICKCGWQLCWLCIRKRIEGHERFYKAIHENMVFALHRFSEVNCKHEPQHTGRPSSDADDPVEPEGEVGL